MEQIIKLPVTLVPKVWDKIKDFLVEAVEYNGGQYSCEDLYWQVVSEQSLVWLVFRDRELKGAAVTELVVYPQRRTVRIVALAGRDFEYWAADLDRTLIGYAKENGARELEAWGRLGLERLLAPFNYRKSCVIVVKEIQ